MTPEDYDILVEKQCSLCAICGIKSEKLFVDHEHSTNRVRGLLCTTCNTGLGIYEKFKANPRVEGYLRG